MIFVPSVFRETQDPARRVAARRPLACASPRAGIAFGACLAAMLGLWGCNTRTNANERQWRHCSCTYVSDFDDQSSAPIEVCGDDKRAEEVAAICIRNDGVGVPTACHCDPRPMGACANSDRCRAATDAAAR